MVPIARPNPKLELIQDLKGLWWLLTPVSPADPVYWLLGHHKSCYILVSLESDSGTAGAPCTPPSVFIIVLQGFAGIREPHTAAPTSSAPSRLCLAVSSHCPSGRESQSLEEVLALQIQSTKARTLYHCRQHLAMVSTTPKMVIQVYLNVFVELRVKN